MIIETIEQFRDLIPTVTGKSLEKYTRSIADAEEWLRQRIVGTELMRVIEQEKVAESELFKRARLVVACKAYLLAIPKMDVIETGNGFAVVNDDTLAPASRERVTALVASMKESLTDAVGGLIEFLEDDVEYRNLWRQSPAFTATVRNYLPTLRLFREYGVFNGGHLDYIDVQPVFHALIVKHIEPIVSPERSAALIAQVAAGTIAAADAPLIESIRLALAGYYNGDMALGDTAMSRVHFLSPPSASEASTTTSPSIFSMI